MIVFSNGTTRPFFTTFSYLTIGIPNDERGPKRRTGAAKSTIQNWTPLSLFSRCNQCPNIKWQMVEYIIGFYCTLSFVQVTINRNKLSRHASMSVKQQICKNALLHSIGDFVVKTAFFFQVPAQKRAQYTSILLCHTSVTD